MNNGGSSHSNIESIFILFYPLYLNMFTSHAVLQIHFSFINGKKRRTRILHKKQNQQ